jgi:hypothetical protein
MKGGKYIDPSIRTAQHSIRMGFHKQITEEYHSLYNHLELHRIQNYPIHVYRLGSYSVLLNLLHLQNDKEPYRAKKPALSVVTPYNII